MKLMHAKFKQPQFIYIRSLKRNTILNPHGDYKYFCNEIAIAIGYCLGGSRLPAMTIFLPSMTLNKLFNCSLLMTGLQHQEHYWRIK
jgi:hypothetical protein